MKVPFSWLKEYVDIACTPYELAEKLLASGFEVEEIVDLASRVKNIVLGQIVKIEQHPNADKLQICKLNCGIYGEAIQIITAAKNIAVGNYVPVALDGAKTANGMDIATTQMRGEYSYGMLCSGEELGLTEEMFTGAGVDGILIVENALSAELKALTEPVVGGYNYLYSKLGQPIQAIVGLNDYILDIAITANRADCQSVYGIAREVAAILNQPIKALNLEYNTVYGNVDNMPNMLVEEDSLALCPQYLGQILQDVTYRQSPKWMQRRLALCGMRAKDAAVDITNYILLEVGQPMHAFDLNAIDEQIVLRRAKNYETVTLLNDKEVNLTREQLVIADNQKILAVAGIMGAKNSGIQPDTKNIFLECAVFDRANIRRSSKALAMRTEASAQFEKGVDCFTSGVALQRALHFFDSLQVAKIVQSFTAITNLATAKKPTGCEDLAEDYHILPATEGGLVGMYSFCNAYSENSGLRILGSRYGYRADVERIAVRTSFRKINSILGLKLAKETIQEILERLQFTLIEVEGEKDFGNIDYKLVDKHLEYKQILVVAPEFRRDIEGHADLAEEVIRILGYENIQPNILKKAHVTRGGLNATQKLFAAVQNCFVEQSYQEIKTYSFISPKDYALFDMHEALRESVEIQNPLGEDCSLMRTTLVPSMLQSILTNIRKNNRAARLFECANVYKKNIFEVLPKEEMHIAVGAYGVNEDFYTLKGAFEAFAKMFALKFEYRPIQYAYLHHGRAAEVLFDGRVVGYLGELAPAIAEELSIECPVYLGELCLHTLMKHCYQTKYFHKLAKFADLHRDISLVVPKDMTCKRIEDVIYATDASITNVALFDTYFDEKLGENNKSLAFTITFESLEEEKMPEEVDAIMERIVDNLSYKLGVYRRV